MSRQQAAERLADVAYAFSGGVPLELSVEGEWVSVPVADDMAMEREIKSKGGRVELDLEVSWSTADAAVPMDQDAATPPVEPDLAAPPVEPDAPSR